MRLPSECARFDGCFGAHDWLIPVRDWCQLEAGWTRLVRVVRLASMRLQELRGGMRTIGATCTAAPKRMRCKHIAAREYDRNGGGIRRRRRVAVGMASLASQRPTARVAGSGSAELRLLTCDRRCQHTISAKTCAVFGPDERQAPIIHLGDQIGRARGRRGAAEGKVRKTDVNGQHTRGAPFLRGGASPEGPRQLPAESGCLQRGKGKGHEATLAWGAAGRIAKADDPRAPSRNRPSRAAGPPPL